MFAIFSRRLRRLTSIVAVAALLLGGSLPAAPATLTATSSILVTATVPQACIVVAQPMVFGNYDPTSATPTNGSTTLVVTCTLGTPYTIGLSTGSGTGATVASRKMTFGSNTLNYSLYSDSGHSTVWGPTIGTNTVAATSTGLPTTYNVYGQIPAQQAASTGAYTDSVTVTVTYWADWAADPCASLPIAVRFFWASRCWHVRLAPALPAI